MMHKGYIGMSVLTVLLTFLAITPANAAIDLDVCLKWARENYPEVRRYNIIEVTAQCNLENAKHNWLPMVTLGVQGSWLNKTPDMSDITKNASDPLTAAQVDFMIQKLNLSAIPNWQYSASVDVVQPIIDGGATKVQKELSRREADVKRAELDVSLSKLEETVQDVYFALLLLEKRDEQMKLQENMIERNIKTLRSLSQEGGAKEIDVKALEVTMLKLQQQGAVLRENMETYRTTLSLLTGHDISKEELSIPRKPGESPVYYSNLPEMKLIDSQFSLLQLQKDCDRVSIIPKLGFVSRLYYGIPSSNIFEDLTDRNPKFNVALGLKLSWDIHSLYNRRNNLKLVQLQEASLDTQRELLIFRHNISNVSVLQQIRHMEEVCSQDERIIEICGELRRAEEVKVENGAGDTNSLIDQINEEADAKLAGAIHEIEYIQSLYKLNHNGQ
ncbi:MAG: TolC family protein [Bacteroidaceae bacterium]|nr:TolC family protein [Bacteroidaceae bacterium]